AVQHGGADRVRVVHAAEQADVHVAPGLAAAAGLPAAAGAPHLDVRDAQQALERALPHPDVLDVGESHGLLADRSEPFADTEAAIGDDVPAQLEVEPQRR